MDLITRDPEPHNADAYLEDAEHCAELGLAASSATLRRLSESHAREFSYEEIRRLYDELYGRLSDELVARVCFMIDADKARFFTLPYPFGREVAKAFPDAIIDIEEAGKCLALDRGTACVFHLMRVLEIGLQKLAANLDISPENNWQRLLNNLRGAVNKLPRSTKEEKVFLAKRSEALAHLQNVKDAWRNEVMHPRSSYTEEQALEVFQHTRALMASLATFL